MRKILLATVATMALSLPAMAQSNMQPKTQKQPSQSEMQQQPTNEQAQSSEQQPVNPQDLSKEQISQIQQALSEKGFDTKNDGIWGPNTEAALKKFQQQNNITANGQLTEQTIAELGANVGGQPEQGTVGAAPSSGSKQENESNQDQMKANPPSEGSGAGQQDQSNPSSGDSGTSGSSSGGGQSPQ